MKYILITVLLVGMITAPSCKREELLSPLPPTSIIDSFAFDTPERIINQVRALYSNLKNGQFYGGRYLIYNDIRGEEFLNQLTNGVTGYGTWNFALTNTAQEVQGLWSQAYYVINTANVFLDGLTTKGKGIVSDSLALDYEAEAKFIRALSYYSLLQLYARPYWDGNGSKPGLPLRLKGNKSIQDYSLERSTVTQIYDQVLTDLNFAETNLPLQYGTAALNTTRAHRNTAIALKTRVYMSMQRYDKVIEEAGKIVGAGPVSSAATGVKHKLESDITTVFASPYTSVESILSMPMSADEVPGTQNQLAYYYSPTSANGGIGNGEYALNPDGIIANTGWTAADKRRSFIHTTASTGKKWLIKYKVRSPFTDWIPVIRYSEVLLNYAEALVRETNSVDTRALEMLNEVRKRSDAATTLAPADFDAMIDALLTERRIEFLGEGRRSPDLLRLGLTIPGKAAVVAVPATDIKYIWPISAAELLLNSKMIDNK
ncbi:RagB/SusD family nutrient uptake outer membrane protein [Pseudobacter ginsenosidimutans]|uniref:SusD-like starch-binding protein associating with outer membrane n=1 Tax=Pseudobacter ginsenosidimutans TaxID=661488 RepID=A0A4Q7MW38_9BACT|nr:RagB/SusD family nutrient uptake outer membrane protein [Pseudobacter ginsenosidimutans]QEC41840.1 RagB/SusD family nutrient uptake outer membrane protein [Pseudobacter ginsenosidimutans]RZS71343.1 SusD-like starch-binding protein associating with outer membrane [Pseudobacter ginsenosidimutans]